MESDFRLEWEWIGGDSVPIASHARTWARLAIRVGDVSVTRVDDSRLRTIRDGIRGPLMPLAEWVVANWWPIFHQVPKAHPVRSARAASSDRGWYARHNLLFAREGFPLPDLSLARADSTRMVLRLSRDQQTPGAYPVRFTEDFEKVVDLRAARDELRGFVDAVIDRLDGCDEADAEELRRAWAHLRSLSGEDLLLRERAAALGLDGDDPDDVSDELADQLVNLEGPESLIEDLLEQPVASPAALGAEQSWLSAVRSSAPSGRPPIDPAVRDEARRIYVSSASSPPWEVGWSLARHARVKLLLLQSTDYGARLHQALSQTLSVGVAPAMSPNLRGWVRGDDSRVVVEPASDATRRFLTARALCLSLLDGQERLVTNAQSWAQSVCRAFAAELVAPSDELRGRVSAHVMTFDEVASLAAQLDAPPQVVEHQLENQDIARVVD